MLFNPDWKKKIKADPMALDTLISWAELQPPDEHYDYRNCHTCYLAQYFHDCGFNRVEVSKNFVKRWDQGLILSLPAQDMLPDLFNWIAEDVPHTYGAALERAKLARDNPQRAHARNFHLHCSW